MTTYNTGWLTPEQSLIATQESDQRAITFSKYHFKGLLKTTEKAYLFIIEGRDGMWVPKSMCMNMFVYDNHSIDVHIPDYCNSKRVNLDE